MYNKLYIYKHEPKNVVERIMNGDKYFWTMISADTEYCKNYRNDMQTKYCGNLLEEIGKIDCKDEKECKLLQLSINTVFKPWTKGGGTKITLNISDSLFIDNCMGIYNDTYDLYSALNDYSHKLVKGTVYLVKCANDKLKIGITTDMTRRIEDLKKEERNQVTEIIDTFKSEDTIKDEAVLHLLCSYYKESGNNGVKCLQEACNSELYTDCEEVRNIWNEYKSKSINGDYTRIYMS